MREDDIIVAGLVTEREQIGGALKRVWPVEEARCFNGLLGAIDDADRELLPSRHAAQESMLPKLG